MCSKSEQQHDPKRRQHDAAPQREPQQPQQAYLESAEVAETDRMPFGDQRQRLAKTEIFAEARSVFQP